MTKEQILMRTIHYQDHGDILEPTQGISSYNAIEASRKKIVNLLFCVVGSTFLIIFSLKDLAEDHYWLAIFTTCTAFFLWGIIIYQKITGDYEKASYAVVYNCFALFLYLFITGGVNNTGPLWCYLLLAIILFILGGKKGIIVNAILILYVIAAFSINDSLLLITNYSEDFKLRFIATLMATFFMILIYEKSRAKSQKIMVAMGEQLYAISRVDSLTGLFNRRAMREYMEYEIRHARRTLKPCSVLFADIDCFKQINDKYGHDCGDLVLKKFADTLKENLRNHDTVSRWGGEEFVVLLPETPGKHIMFVGEKLRKAIEDIRFVYNNKEFTITASFGGAEVDIEVNIDETIKRADKNQYQAKAEGRNRVIA